MAKKKAATAVKKYQALVSLANDKTGKRYNAGDTVTEKDFDADVLAYWLSFGIIAEVS